MQIDKQYIFIGYLFCFYYCLAKLIVVYKNRLWVLPMENCIYLQRISLQGKFRLACDLRTCPDLSMILQNINGWTWSETLSIWHMPYYENHLAYLQKRFGHLAVFHDLDLAEQRLLTLKETSNLTAYPVPEAFYQQMRQKRYSENTQKTYASVLSKFLAYYHNTLPEKLTEQQVRDYMVYLVDKVQCSASYQRQVINAIKLFFQMVVHQPLSELAVTAPRRKKLLPVVLSEAEVASLLSQVTNLKHKALLYCIYSAGLRRNEVLELTVADIDSARHCIMVRAAKGNKDRVTLLSNRCLFLLRDYFRAYRPQHYLFEGAEGGKYSATSLRKIFYRALAASKITKKASLYTLRHYVPTY
jgi:site-specific recombinase XerD